MSFNKKFLRIYPVDGVTVIHLGEMEIWDGADMSLLRETLTTLVDRDKVRAVGVDMTYVKYIPGGFFGMLFDWHELGVRIQLFTPQPNVRRMLWFDRFFEPLSDATFELRPDRADEFPLGFAEEEEGMLPGSVMNVLLAGSGRN
jgi:anti-anti-sigma regulatory factor